MPTYSVGYQTDRQPSDVARGFRSNGDGSNKQIDVVADDIADALVQVTDRLRAGDVEPRIISVEEVLPIDIDSFTDEQLTQVLTSSLRGGKADGDGINPDTLPEGPLYADDDFAALASDIADLLSNSNFLPGLTLTLVGDGYTSVDVYDRVTHNYRSVGRDEKQLIGDRSLTGWPAVLSVARELMSIAEYERLV